MTSAAQTSGDGPGAGPAPAARPSLLYAVKQVELAIRSRMDELVRASGITALQYTALTVLRRREGLSSAQLARNSFVTAQSMADMVGHLERRGLITRRRDPANRRALLISLTEEGHALLTAHDRAMAELEDRMLTGLTAHQRRDLGDYLNRCRNALAGGPPH